MDIESAQAQLDALEKAEPTYTTIIAPWIKKRYQDAAKDALTNDDPDKREQSRHIANFLEVEIIPMFDRMKVEREKILARPDHIPDPDQ